MKKILSLVIVFIIVLNSWAPIIFAIGDEIENNINFAEEENCNTIDNTNNATTTADTTDYSNNNMTTENTDNIKNEDITKEMYVYRKI